MPRTPTLTAVELIPPNPYLEQLQKEKEKAKKKGTSNMGLLTNLPPEPPPKKKRKTNSRENTVEFLTDVPTKIKNDRGIYLQA